MPIKQQKNADGHFVCPHCAKTTEKQNTMHYHLKKHEGALPHACKHCSKKFLHKQTLDLHIQAWHPETTQEVNLLKCPCGDCTQESRTKANRLIHFLRIHLAKETEALKMITKDAETVCGCKGCKKDFKSLTAQQYHAANCITVDETHALQNQWKTLA